MRLPNLSEAIISLMKPEIIEKLRRINDEFYQTFADSFSSTRRRIQPGIRRILEVIPEEGNWLDIGCGNGALAIEWVRQQRKGIYFGIDFSERLLENAKDEIIKVGQAPNLSVEFFPVELMQADWIKKLPLIEWQGTLMFAVLHHIPGKDNRERICLDVRNLLPAGMPFYLSVWQIQNSPRMIKRIQPWSNAGLDKSEVEEGDVVVDWRAELPDSSSQPGLRFVHIFNEDELSALAVKTGFKVVRSFYSDGKEGNLALYHEWV